MLTCGRRAEPLAETQRTAPRPEAGSKPKVKKAGVFALSRCDAVWVDLWVEALEFPNWARKKYIYIYICRGVATATKFRVDSWAVRAGAIYSTT